MPASSTCRRTRRSARATSHWAGLDDPVIEISVTPNRGDALSVRGVARDLAAAGLGTLKPWSRRRRCRPPMPSPLHWEIDDPRACTWVLGRAVRGVRNGPSPQWLQDRLTAIGLRPINALVDITNFFTFDLGRPLHVFDVAKVQGSDADHAHGARGRDARRAERQDLRADRRRMASSPTPPAPEALGGVIGGEPSGCDEAHHRVSSSNARCSTRCASRCPAAGTTSAPMRAQRFERGIDPGAAARCARGRDAR